MNQELKKQINLHCKRLSRANSKGYVLMVRRSLLALLADGVKNAQTHLDARALTVAPYTVRDYTNRLRAFGKAFKIQTLIDIVRPRAGGIPKLRAIFTEEEVLKIADCVKIPPMRRLYWRLLYRCGLRPSEARSVTKNSVMIRGEEAYVVLPANVQKSGRFDPVEAPLDLAEEVRALAPDTVGGWDKVLRDKRYLTEVFSEDMNLAGIGAMQGDAKRVPKDLRSFFISYLYAQGESPETVRQAARHAHASTGLAHYLRMRAGEARERTKKAMRKF